LFDRFINAYSEKNIDLFNISVLIYFELTIFSKLQPILFRKQK